jgi:hypothetical protein
MERGCGRFCWWSWRTREGLPSSVSI